MNKRQRENEDQGYYKVFNASKKVLRSPEQKKRQEAESREVNSGPGEETLSSSNMEELRKMIQSVLEKMDENTKELKQEINEMKLEMVKKEEVWKKEKKILADRIEKLERRSELEEKMKKKNNIVIKGLKYKQNPEVEVNKLFEEQMQVKADTNKIVSINRGKSNEILIVEMRNWEQKQQVMAAKSKLKATKIYIENDLTWEERNIQREIRNIARVEKTEGKRVKIGYQKLIINEEVYEWDKQENGIVLKGIDDKKQSKN